MDASKTSLYDLLVFSARDWSADATDAWIYGIIVGWNDASLKLLREKFAWGEIETDRLKAMHREFLGLK